MFEDTEQFHLLYQEMPAVSLVLDDALVVREVNSFGCNQLGYRHGELVGMPFHQLCFHEEREYLEQNLRQCLREREGNRRWECMRQRKDGTRFWVRDTVRILDDEAGASYVLISSEDITETRYLINELERKGSTDDLTGLYNRRKFDFFLEEHVLSVQGDGATHVLFFIDLDHFKVVNDTCGHLCGDQFLRQIAKLLRSQIRGQDILGRLGGDEYGLILTYCSVAEAREVGEKLLSTLDQFRFTWEDKSFSTGASIGGVVIEAGGGDASTLMSRADSACYVAKQEGRNRICMYDQISSDTDNLSGKENWFGRIYEALDEGRFELYAQRIESVVANGTEPGNVEVLLRMRNDDGELISPAAFMPAAERYNLSTRIDRWVIEQLVACYQQTGCPGCATFFVNLSGLTLGDSNYIQEVSRLLRGDAAQGMQVCFEITESAAIRNLDEARHFMEAFRQLGCQFALDDFGSGFSSFGYLKGLPVDYIKIDGGFVKSVDHDPLDQAVVRAIHEVARAFGTKTVAEWVESEAAFNMVRGMGVEYVQGYHIGGPLPLAGVRQ